MKPIALLVHVDDVERALDWYSEAFSDSVRVTLPQSDVKALQIGDFLLEIVPSDGKVGSCESGTVLYWHTANLTGEMTRFQMLGSAILRGPIEIENGCGMCQMTDTFGNIIGLRGPMSS